MKSFYQSLSRVPDFLFVAIYGGLFLVFYNRPTYGLLLALLVVSFLNLLQKQMRSVYWLAAIPCFAILQLLIAPYVVNDSDLAVIFNYGPLSMSEYFNLSVPLVFCYTVPFFFRVSGGIGGLGKAIGPEGQRLFYSEMARTLLMVGFVSEFLFMFLSGVPILGALLAYGQLAWRITIPIYLFELKRLRIAIIIFLIIAIQSWQSTLYWHLYMAVIFVGIYGVAVRRIKVWMSVLVLITLFGSAIVLQVIKHEQRNWREISSVEEIGDVVMDAGVKSAPVLNFFGRLNQGVHDSFVYNKVLDGEFSDSIFESFVGTALPRFLYSAKPTFSSEKFTDFTGYDAMGSSFITMSGCAEASSNFGFFFGGVFLVIWGIFVVFYVNKYFLKTLSGRYKIFSLIPYYHLLRVEVDFFHWFCGLFYGLLVVKYLVYVHRNSVERLSNSSI